MIRGRVRNGGRVGGLAVLVLWACSGCVPNRLFNPDPTQYLQTLKIDGVPRGVCDLAIVEFDDQGQLWDPQQLDDTIALIGQRNAEAKRGVLVVVFMHGWQNNADPSRTGKDLAKFRGSIAGLARTQQHGGPSQPEHVVGVYLGWCGTSTTLPLVKELTFWSRKQAGDRMISLHTQEALLRVMRAAKARPGSRCVVSGHSMGGMIVGETLAGAYATLMALGGDTGVPPPADLVVLTNPARDALAAWRFVDFLKRSGTRLQLRDDAGRVVSAGGRPMMVSITSTADTATGIAYPFGRSIKNLAGAFRRDHGTGEPSQRAMTVYTEGHVDYLVSHHASVIDGDVVLTAVPDAWNDTPFWIIRATPDISRDHGDIDNPNLQRLIAQIIDGNRTYDAGVHPVLVTGSAAEASTDSGLGEAVGPAHPR